LTRGSKAAGSCSSAWRTFLGSVEFARLVGNGSQFVPGRGEPRGHLDGVLEALHGGIEIVPLEVLLRLQVFVQGGLRNGQLGGRDGVLGYGGGEIEVGILQIEGEGNPPVGVGGGGTHFHRAARFSAPRDEHGDGVIVGAEFLEAEAAGDVAESNGGEGVLGAE
jgi:hypothetical protein